jgi:hypothetical protein
MEVGVKVLIGVLRLETAKGVQANMKKRCLRLTIIWRRQCGTRYTITRASRHGMNCRVCRPMVGSDQRTAVPGGLVRQFPTTKRKPRRVRPGFFA